MAWIGVHARRRLGRGGGGRDAGTTMMELVVGMTVMGVFMVMFTGAITLMFNSATKTESLNNTSAQLNAAFIRLDTVVRYATAVSQPGQSSGDWYVELQSIDPQTGDTQCTQLRLTSPSDLVAPQQLQQRTWTVEGDGEVANQSAFMPIASNITTGVAASEDNQPFKLDLEPKLRYQRLQFRLKSAMPDSQGRTESNSDFTFTALNSTRSNSPTGICEEVTRS